MLLLKDFPYTREENCEVIKCHTQKQTEHENRDQLDPELRCDNERGCLLLLDVGFKVNNPCESGLCDQIWSHIEGRREDCRVAFHF